NTQRPVCLSQYMLLHIISAQTDETQPAGQKLQNLWLLVQAPLITFRKNRSKTALIQ
ncbi:unnamed protein product, partial [Bubo scandiacus]